LGTVDSWILFNLTGGQMHACDMTNASRTQLFDLHALKWAPELLDIFGIPAATLPEAHYLIQKLRLDKLTKGTKPLVEG
jgi:glycerol kinase